MIPSEIKDGIAFLLLYRCDGLNSLWGKRSSPQYSGSLDPKIMIRGKAWTEYDLYTYI